MTDSPRDALDRLVEPFDQEAADWADVLDRARVRRARRIRRAVLVATFALAALVLTVPFGLAGQVIGLFRDDGRPVPVASLSPSDRGLLVTSMCSQVELVTPPGRPPEKRCADGEPTITEIANDGKRRYWKVAYPNGIQCLASGRVRGYRETGGGRTHIGQMGCGKGPNLFPSPRRPITVDAAISIERGDRRATLFRASGLAGEGVATVGLVDMNGDVLKTDVKGRTYTFDRPPDRPWESIAAYDDSGDEVYRESLHLELPSRPPTRPPSSRPRKPTPPPPLTPLPNQSPLQHGTTSGAAIDVYRSSLVAVHLAQGSRPYSLLRPAPNADPRVTVSCARLAYGAGRWASLGTGVSVPFGREIRAVVAPISPVQFRGESPRPPYDACWLKATYGLRWNDARGMHAAVEVAFTPLGHRYFDQLAIAQDLALFMRTPQMRTIREGMRAGRVPNGARIAAMFPSRVVALANRTDTADAASIGIWSNERDLIVASRTSEDGRRMYVTLRNGAFGPHNLAGLKSLYY
jgi:hypothetical protein